MPVVGTSIYPFACFAHTPILGTILAQQDPVMPIAVILGVLVWFVVFRTRWGITLRTCGEKPDAAINAGIRLSRVRMIAGIICGALCGLGGAQLALFSANQWQENMIAGRGWIAIVLVIFARWHPILLIFGALLFGGLNALQINLQAKGWQVSPHILGMLPFVITIVVMALASWRLRKHPGWMPAALGKQAPPEIEKTLIN
jgi:simple sugar transport system permease protein